MANYVLFLPPSEGKTKGGSDEVPYRVAENFSRYNSFTSLTIPRSDVFEELYLATTQMQEKELEKIYDLKGNNLDEAIDNTQDMLNLPTKPAIHRYSGVMFKALDYDSMLLHQKTNFDENTYFIDGMFGILKPQDYIPTYKLKITAKIKTIDCAKFWREKLESTLKSITKNKFVIDLLPQTHEKVLSVDNSANRIKIIFGEELNGELKQIGHNSKKLKGEFIRYLVDKEEITMDYLREFQHTEGFKYSEKFSDDNNLVFVK